MVRRRRRAQRLLWRRVAIAAALIALSGILVGVVFAGSPARLADGVRIAGIDVGGMSPGAAKKLRVLLKQPALLLTSVAVTPLPRDAETT